MLGAAVHEHIGPELGVAAGAVIEIGQQHAVARGGEPARHVAQLLADAGGVHQQQHGRMHAAIRPADEGLHRAVFGGDVLGLLDHDFILPDAGSLRDPGYAGHARDAQGTVAVKQEATAAPAVSSPGR